jgi:hypothetical protein
VAAAITVALLALLSDGVFALLQRLLVPWRRTARHETDAIVAVDEPLSVNPAS